MLSYEKLKDSVTVQAWVREGEKKAMIQFLHDKFINIPENILTTLNSIDDEAIIDEVMQKIFKVTSMDEVKEVLKIKK